MRKMILLWLLLAVFSNIYNHHHHFAHATDEAGETFLQANRDQPGVQELVVDSGGLQYKILVNGTGLYHPQPLCQCLVHYEGRLLSGHVFDSSAQRGEPLRVSPSQVIDGWSLAMHAMVEGDKWELFIPSELGYGAMGHEPDIPPHALLMFTLEMVAVDCGDQKILALKCHVETGASCSDRELAYIDKIKHEWTETQRAAELRRLGRILNESSSSSTTLKQELKEWILRREYILKHFVSSSSSSSSSSKPTNADEQEL